MRTLPRQAEGGRILAGSAPPKRLEYWPLVVVAAGGVAYLATAIQLASDSTRQLFGHMADDAFYYIDIARRFPHIGTAPGITTTGFHPLYWLVLVPIVHIFPGTAAVRAALLFLLAAHIVAGWLIYVLLKRRWGPAVAGVVAVFWMASAALQAIVVLGLETALVEVTMLGLLLACDPRARADRRRCLGVGVMLGLTYLARNDAVILSVPIVAAWLWTRRSDFAKWRSVLGVPVVSAFVAAPWAIFLLVHGSILPDSARALPTLAGRQGGMGAIVRWTLDTVLSLIVSLGVNRVSTGPLLGVAVGSGLIVGLGLFWRRGRWTLVEGAFFAAVPVLFTLYTFTLKGIRLWYFVYVGLWLFVLIVPPIAERIGEVLRPISRRAPVALGLVGALLFAVLLAGAPAKTAGEVDKYQAALVTEQMLPPGTHLASFNSGVYQFVLSHDVVENLDGVVNTSVIPYVQRHQLCRYLADTGTSWYIDSSLDQIVHEPGIRVVSLHVLVPASSGHVEQLLARIHITGCAATSRAPARADGQRPVRTCRISGFEHRFRANDTRPSGLAPLTVVENLG
jgi:hypothetical protein